MSASEAPFGFDHLDFEDAHVLVARGEFDLKAADAFRDNLVAALGDGGRPVVLDLTELRFMDSTSLGIMLHALRQAWARGQGFLVAGPLRDPVAQLVGITGVERFLTVHDSRDSALSALSG